MMLFMKKFFNSILAIFGSIGMVLGTIFAFVVGFIIFSIIIDILSF